MKKRPAINAKYVKTAMNVATPANAIIELAFIYSPSLYMGRELLYQPSQHQLVEVYAIP